MTTAPAQTHSGPGWRTPVVVLICGCAIAMATFGPRSAMGFFTTPILTDRGFSIESFSMAMAIQNLLWGLGQPFAGAIADRFGTLRVLAVGLGLYAAGLYIMAQASDPYTFSLSAGVLVGFGLSGASFNLVLSAFAKLMPDSWRSLALGAGAAAGSFGQFVFAPLAVILIREIGWQGALVTFAVIMVCAIPLAFAVSTPPVHHKPGGDAASNQSLFEALREAFGHRSYVLLVAGFFVCGFHLAFVTIHLPKYMVEQGLAVEVGGTVMALIGLCNIAGSMTVGVLSRSVRRAWLLSAIYFGRAVAIALFVMLPITNWSAYLFGGAMGILWLSTVPPTSSLCASMFGTKWLAMLYGFAFFSHQVGAFVGLLIAGWTRQAFGNYDVIWGLGIALGLAAALVNLPISDKAVERTAKPAA